MMHDFLSNNRDELARRCRVKVGTRPGRSATEQQLQDGIPLFLEQLIQTLKIELSPDPMASRLISGPADGATALSAVGASAAQHGKDLLALGLSVDQVVHDYGDLCQAITDLAVEREAPFEVDEFRTLNRCLDNAISDAVTEFSYQRDVIAAEANVLESNRRVGFLAHELRNLLGTASLAFAAAKAGQLSLAGATGSILERSLQGLDRLITESLDDVRPLVPSADLLGAFSLAGFIGEIYEAAAMSARQYGCTLRTLPVDGELALTGARDLLIAAVANLLQNAFKFTRTGTEVRLSAYASGEYILIDVQDHCGGLRAGAAERMFLPFTQMDRNRDGIGLGLTIAKQTVNANGGTLSVRSIAGEGCVFSISLPRRAVLA
ncbi:sensor histidine kinase [Massilia sp. DWR3-1-1]|uniref:sensor histidine kinase n=1 Tax=Massilia sp. DWR3-1-1 TaxID=2804559 RepID=UPI003CEADD8A